MRIGIVGGGLMGLALAYHLTRRQHDVVVFERDEQLGGLTTYHDYGSFHWDRFYHGLVPTDRHLIGFLKEIGLENHLKWDKISTGFYVDEQYYPMTSGLEFLRFPPVSLIGKIRLALTILYCSRINDWQRLEKISVEDWLTKTCGKSTYEKLWRPLLLSKLGEHYKRVSAVFIWSYIKRLFETRDGSAQKEQLGYISGSYKAVFERLESSIQAAGGVIRKGSAVSDIEARPEGGLRVKHDQYDAHFDKVIFTSPISVLERVASEQLVELKGNDHKIEYLGVICMALITRKPITPYYVVNIADQRVPFTGVIAMSNLVAAQETNDLHITYLPKYVHSDDPILRESDDKLRALFFDGINMMFPDLKEEDIESVHINRAVKVQPLQVINYSKLVPDVITKHKDFFVLNTSQFVNNTLNNNEVIRMVENFLETYGQQLEEPSSFYQTTLSNELVT